MKINTSVFLLKDSYTKEEDAFIEGANFHDCKVGKIAIWKKRGKEPCWGSFINSLLDNQEIFSQSISQGAAISLKVKNRIMVLCFAAGRFYVNQDRVEDRFGLKTCLNLQTTDKFKDIKVKSLENSGAQKIEISPSWTDMSSFSINIENEILKSVTAQVDDTNFGKNVSGFDSLSIKIDLDNTNLTDACTKLLEAFDSDLYKQKFGYIDKICFVNKADVVKRLNLALVEKIRNRDENVWMCIPDFIDWENVEYFKYLGGQADDIYVDRFAERIDDDREPAKCIDFLKTSKINAFSSEEKLLYSKSAYYCITAEVDLNGKTYLLNESKWFEIEDSFSAELKQLKIDIAQNSESYQSANLIPYKSSVHKTEGGYNEACAKTGLFNLWDKQLVEKVEVCDLWSAKKEFIHVKKYSSSAVLSHLFNQGLVSATLMCRSNDFKKKVEAKGICTLSKPFASPESFSPGSCSVKFAIVSKDINKFNLPHFSLISYRQVKKDIEDMGYKVGIIKVPFEK